MKKYVLVLLTFVPCVAGNLVNYVRVFPGVFRWMADYGIPFGVLAFWFFLGSRYAGTDWSAVPAVFIGNAAGIFSAAVEVAVLAFHLGPGRSIPGMMFSRIATAFSTSYFSAAPRELLYRLAMLFPPYRVTAGTFVAVPAVYLLIMIAVFAVGYFWGEKCRKKKK